MRVTRAYVILQFLMNIYRIYVLLLLRGFFTFLDHSRGETRGKGTKGRNDAGSKDEAVEVERGTGHCMPVTLKFRPRTTFPKSATGKRENGREEQNCRSSVL